MGAKNPIVNKTSRGEFATVGKRLRLLRFRHDWQLREAARRLNLSESYLCKIEQGHRLPNAQLMQRFAALYGVTPEQVYFGNTDWKVKSTKSEEETFFPLESILASA